VKATCNNKIVYWQVVGRDNELDLEAIKVFLLGFIVAMVGLALQ
jgi:hypothetical protein